MLRAVVRFSKSSFASEVFEDVKDGIRHNTSCGYRIEKYAPIKGKDGILATRWKPLEVSIVSIPADESVGVGRSENEDERIATMTTPNENDDDKKQQRSAPPSTPANPIDVNAIAREAADKATVAAEERQSAVVTVMELAARHNLSSVVSEFLKPENLRGLSGDAILARGRGIVLEKMPEAKPLENPSIGLTNQEAKRFSVMKLVRSLADPSKQTRTAAGFELEACAAADDLAAKHGIAAARGMRLPPEVMLNWDMSLRTLNTSDDSALIPTEHLAGSFIDLLRKRAALFKAGARILNGLSGNVDIPRQATSGVATWVSAEHGDATNTEPTFDTVSLTPKDLAAYVDLSRRVMQQASPDIEALVRADILAFMYRALDLAGLEGTASNGQPRGVRNVVGINKPTAFAAATPTWAEVVAMETALDDDEALDGSLSYIGRTNMRGSLKTVLKAAGVGGYIMGEDGMLNGYPYHATNQTEDGVLYFGNWADVLIGFWSGLDLTVDTAALALKGGTRLIAFQTADVAVRHPQSFAWNEYDAG